MKIFNDGIEPYNEALKRSGFDSLKGYMESEFIRRDNKKKRKPRKIIFFNPPFCNTVKTKVGKQFFHLVNLHFAKNSKLCKIFNKNTIKLSYSCLPNIKNIINSHNRKILKENKTSIKNCNCRMKNKCPFDGHCLKKGIYKATVLCSKGNKEYIGSTGVSFKVRYNQHKYSLDSKKSNQTTLSKFYKINRKDITNIKWSILHEVNEYIPDRNDNCSICNLERMAIAEMDREKSLNVRNELASVCPHFKSFYF